MKRWVVLVTLLLGASGAAEAQDRDPLRVLFVGNSYTRFNGLPELVSHLAASDPEGPRLHASSETAPGRSLRAHWERHRVRRRIAGGRWDAVVLQEHSLAPVEAPREMTEYARRLAEQAREAGARVVLFETWARHPEHPFYEERGLAGPDDLLAVVAAHYERVGRMLGARVAPVGRAWRLALAEVPGVRLHRPDGSHPALAGSYLGACVLYGTLTGRDPRAATYAPFPLSEERARAIRAVAALALEAPRRTSVPRSPRSEPPHEVHELEERTPETNRRGASAPAQ